MTPREQSSPSAASLFSAPRSLNEPVRCRLSALSVTSAPRRWVSVIDGSTGVRLATSAIARRARWTSSTVTAERGGDAATGYSASAITASISTRAPSGSDATPTVLLAGGPSAKNVP